MALLITLDTDKTYASEANAIRAVENFTAGKHHCEMLRYFIQRSADGRFFPVFMGEEAVRAGVHFHFTVVS